MERRDFLRKSALATLGTALAGTGLVQAFNHINNNESKSKKMKIVVLLVHYHTLMEYLGWTSVGEVVASGVWTAGSVKSTDYPQQAYQLGKSL